MTTKLQELKKHDVILVRENTDVESIIMDQTTLPTDIHLIEYDDEGTVKIDAVRAFKMSDIFDAYWDLGSRSVISIKAGYGCVRPNLYNAKQSEDS